MSEYETRTAYRDLSDDEKRERHKEMRDNANAMREKFKDGKYYGFKEAIDEVKDAYGFSETAVASAKLVGKSLFNIGRFTVTELAPTFLEEVAKMGDKNLKR